MKIARSIGDSTGARRINALWKSRLGFDSDVAKNILPQILTFWNEDAQVAFEFWRDLYLSTSSSFPSGSLFQGLDILATLDFSCFTKERRPSAELFLLQTYTAQIIRAFIERIFGASSQTVDELFGATPFDWANSVRASLILDADALELPFLSMKNLSDPFAEVYGNFFPAQTRRRLGEFYTPRPLVARMTDVALKMLESNRVPTTLDPTCGAGAFLTEIARRRLRAGETPERALDSVFGFDLSPLAVDAAKANLLFTALSNEETTNATLTQFLAARRALCSKSGDALLPVYLFDAIRNCFPATTLAPFPSRPPLEQPSPTRLADLILGNPPWIAWDRLSPEYRAKTDSYWRLYGLFSLSNKAARYGGAKKDLAGLVTYASIDRRLKSDGLLAFVLPKNLFQSGESGEGFRQFGATSSEVNFKESPKTERRKSFLFQALAIDDLSELKIFPQVATKAVAFYARKGRQTIFPFPVRRFHSIDELSSSNNDSPILEEGEVKPIDGRLGASLQFIFKNDSKPAERLETRGRKKRPSPALAPSEIVKRERNDALVERLFDAFDARSQERRYVAQLGANAAGGSGVYWLEDRSRLDDKVINIRNLGSVGRKKVRTIDARAESELLYPLLRWRDVDEFKIKPTSTLILIPQDPVRRRGIDCETMNRNYPNALLYLRNFEEFLRSRAAYKRYQERAPFWSLYNVDEATFAPFKVVWRRMDSFLRAVAVGLDVERARPIVPQETLALVPVGSMQEADYLATILNSSPSRRLVANSSAANTKSFGAPSMLDALPIPIFDPENADSLELARYGESRRLGE